LKGNIMNDLHNNSRAKVAIIPTQLGTTGAITGSVIDRQGYGGVEFLVTYGSITTTGTAVALIVKEGDVTGTLTSVADSDLLGTETLAGLAAGARVAGTGKEVTKRIGYKGVKRYVSVNLNHTGTTSVGYVCAEALLHNPNNAPTSNP
jgi:hypothetical protein